MRTAAVVIGIGIIVVVAIGLSLGSRADHNSFGAKMMHDNAGYGATFCPMCGGPWHNPMNWDGRVPSTLPRPQNREWVNRLREILTREKLSLAQYSKDEDKFNIRMPYMMIIPQERDHIEWIEDLFKAYGLSTDGKVPSLRKSGSIREAYRIGMNLEAELIPRYKWLIKNAEDDTTKKVLDTILFQTRMHFTMFAHVWEMGHMGKSGMGRMHGMH